MLSTLCDTPASWFSVHATAFPTLRARLAWRRAAGRDLPRREGLSLAKVLGQIGGARSHGFARGVPDPRRQLTLLAWTEPGAFERFAADPLGRALAAHGWHAFLQTLSTRGSHYGRRPLAGAGRDGWDGPIGVMTLGRASPRTLARFLWHGDRLSSETLGAPGLIRAVSAGFPLTGNATFSLWESEQRMLDFAYGREPGRHRATATAKPPILVEQLSARFRPVG